MMGRFGHLSRSWPLALGLLLAGCGTAPPPSPVEFSSGITKITWQPSDQAGRESFAGTSMGTSLSVVLATSTLDTDKAAGLGRAMVDRLAEINRRMSNWDPGSELSRFNDHKSTEPFAVSAETALVVAEALEVGRLSDGWYDVTVAPLVRAWGFNSPDPERPPPTAAEVAGLLESVGLDKVVVSREPPTLAKTHPAVQVDLSSIAKGYGVDEVSRVLLAAGYPNHFVEIGGEVVARGKRPDGQPWRTGIRKPTVGIMDSPLQDLVALSDKACATSGDYFNYRKLGEQRLQHTIDPRTGHPVTHRLASVTVVADNCMRADALATAAMALGPDRGLQLLEEQPNVEGWLLIRGADDSTLESRRTTGFDALLVK